MPWYLNTAAAQPAQPVWQMPQAGAVNPPIWSAAVNNAGCAATSQTFILAPGQVWSATIPAQGCAPAFTGWWTTINVGTPPDADDGPAGVREPVRR